MMRIVAEVKGQTVESGGSKADGGVVMVVKGVDDIVCISLSVCLSVHER